MTREELHAILAKHPAILAPMEDVTDAVFRALARRLGAGLCVTEFVNVEGLLRGCRHAKRKVRLAEGDAPTAIQIYGSSPERLAEAARVAEAARPAFLDINCGCWVPKIAGRGAGAGWLRDPDAMVAMAGRVARSVSLPVTVKTRIGWGAGGDVPIVDLARRLEDAGVAAITIHCRAATAGHAGAADWGWAAKARAAVTIPVIVNGDIWSAEDFRRALAETGCEAAMIGRRAIEHPWIFREVLGGPPPTSTERLDLCAEHLRANAEARGEVRGVRCTRRHLTGYLSGLRGAAALRRALFSTDSLAGSLAILEAAKAALPEPEAAAAAAPGHEAA